MKILDVKIRVERLEGGERIVSVKTLTNDAAPSQPRSVERVVTTGQYL